MMQSKVLLDNSRVKVVEFRLHPGDKIEMHTHPAYLTYILNAAKIRVTFPDGKSDIVHLEEGKVRFSDGITHAIENIGSTEMVNLDIELKQ